jgi:DNA helicase-2/ATP-dependent DNA helicase PcrA
VVDARHDNRLGDRLLDDLDERQREAVTSLAGPLAILAPAGSGKTRVLTRRIAWRTREGLADARHVLAVTFTRKAAAALVGRLSTLGADGVTAGTFHALALAHLRRRAAERGRTAPTVVASKTRILGAIVDAAGADRNAALAEVAAEIDWAKAQMVPPEQYVAEARTAGRRPSRGLDVIAGNYARYEADKRKKHCYDFDDLLWWCADAIERDPTFAAAQRWRFRHLFVDEFQDATPLQVRLLRAWLGDRNDLCVVGDVAQAIYGFAGADATPLARFGDAFPGGTLVELDRNYRSTPQIVAVAETVLARGARVERAPVRAVREDGSAPRHRSYDDESAEAAGIAQGCWEAFVAGVPWDDMAILFRTNAQASSFEVALARRGVPCHVPNAGRPNAGRFVDRPVVRALLDRLREMEREARGRPFAEHLADLAPDDGGSPSEDAGAPDDVPAGGPAPAEETREHRDALLRLGRDYLSAEEGPGSVAGFVAWLELATRGERAGGPGVDLLTFHRAKGLEWRVVFVAGLEQGLVPVSWATSVEQLAEERRLLHVGLGRAGDELHLSWARHRTVGGRRTVREPSPWLGALSRRADAVAPAAVDARRELDIARETLAAAGPPLPVPRRVRRIRSASRR